MPPLGQERGNIEVLAVLAERGADVLAVTHARYGHLHVRPMLDRLGFAWTVAADTDRLGRGPGVRGWPVNLARMARTARSARGSTCRT